MIYSRSMCHLDGVGGMRTIYLKVKRTGRERRECVIRKLSKVSINSSSQLIRIYKIGRYDLLMEVQRMHACTWRRTKISLIRVSLGS